MQDDVIPAQFIRNYCQCGCIMSPFPRACGSMSARHHAKSLDCHFSMACADRWGSYSKTQALWSPLAAKAFQAWACDSVSPALQRTSMPASRHRVCVRKLPICATYPLEPRQMLMIGT